MPRMSKPPADQTLAVLEQIRDAVSQTNERISQTNERLDLTREELSSRLDRVEKHTDGYRSPPGDRAHRRRRGGAFAA